MAGRNLGGSSLSYSLLNPGGGVCRANPNSSKSLSEGFTRILLGEDSPRSRLSPDGDGGTSDATSQSSSSSLQTGPGVGPSNDILRSDL